METEKKTILETLGIPKTIERENYSLVLKDNFTWVEVLPYIQFSRDELVDYIGNLTDVFVEGIKEKDGTYLFDKTQIKKKIFDMTLTNLEELNDHLEILLRIITKSIEHGTRKKDKSELGGFMFWRKRRDTW